jgi:hypothetical protein
MKKGFQLEIQRGLSEEDMEIALSFANKWIKNTCMDDELVFWLGGRTGGWTSKSHLKRGSLGYTYIKEDRSLVFRRISSSKRVFAIVNIDTMTLKDGNELNTKGCMCAHCNGGQKVIWRNNKKPETFVYAMVGDIKG